MRKSKKKEDRKKLSKNYRRRVARRKAKWTNFAGLSFFFHSFLLFFILLQFILFYFKCFRRCQKNLQFVTVLYMYASKRCHIYRASGVIVPLGLRIQKRGCKLCSSSLDETCQKPVCQWRLVRVSKTTYVPVVSSKMKGRRGPNEPGDTF